MSTIQNSAHSKKNGWFGLKGHESGNQVDNGRWYIAVVALSEDTQEYK